MWDYIYFYLHLERIDISDHNAIESYVHRQVSDVLDMWLNVT